VCGPSSKLLDAPFVQGQDMQPESMTPANKAHVQLQGPAMQVVLQTTSDLEGIQFFQADRTLLVKPSQYHVQL